MFLYASLRFLLCPCISFDLNIFPYMSSYVPLLICMSLYVFIQQRAESSLRFLMSRLCSSFCFGLVVVLVFACFIFLRVARGAELSGPGRGRLEKVVGEAAGKRI